MALNWSAFNTAAFTGPLLAGLLLSLGGATLSFAAVVLTCALMLQALLRLRTAADPLRSLCIYRDWLPISSRGFAIPARTISYRWFWPCM